jgi:hypothetical protein
MLRKFAHPALMFGLILAAGLVLKQCAPPLINHSGKSLVPDKPGAYYGPSVDDVAREIGRRTGERVEDALEPE